MSNQKIIEVGNNTTIWHRVIMQKMTDCYYDVTRYSKRSEDSQTYNMILYLLCYLTMLYQLRSYLASMEYVIGR